MFKRILLATDGSPATERSILYAGHLARREGAEVIVLHAYELPQQYAEYESFATLEEQYRRVAQELVNEVVHQLREDGVQVRSELRTGSAADAIIAASTDYDIDLIVMSPRGSNNLQDIMDSVSVQVLSRTTCPVLEIP